MKNVTEMLDMQASLPSWTSWPFARAVDVSLDRWEHLKLDNVNDAYHPGGQCTLDVMLVLIPALTKVSAP